MPSRLPRNVWILGISSLLNDVSSEMILPLLPLFLVKGLGSGVLDVGLIEGVAEATASILKFFSGALSDRLGQRRGLVVLGYGLSNFVKPLIALASTPLWVFAARFGDRVGKGIRVAPRDALLADSAPPELRGAAFGLRQSLDNVGGVLGPLAAFGVMLASNGNYRLVFALAFVPGLLTVLLVVFGLREVKTDKPLARTVRWRELVNLSPGFWLLACVALVFNLGNSSDAFLLLKASEVGIPTVQVPLVLVIMNLVYAASAYPVGQLSDRIGRAGLLAGGILLYALVYLGFAFAVAPWQIWILFVFYGLHLGLTQGVLSALVADQVEADRRGTAFGLLNLATGAALLPASLIAGALWQTTGSAAAFIFGAACAVIALLLLGWYLRRPSVR